MKESKIGEKIEIFCTENDVSINISFGKYGWFFECKNEGWYVSSTGVDLEQGFEEFVSKYIKKSREHQVFFDLKRLYEEQIKKLLNEEDPS